MLHNLKGRYTMAQKAHPKKDSPTVILRRFFKLHHLKGGYTQGLKKHTPK
jgi:hypothetical protein